MKAKVIFTLMVVCFFLSACASTQQAWNKLSSDEKARVILSGMQDQLTNLWLSGKAAVTAKPEYEPFWKEKIVPAFDAANKALKFSMDMAMAGKVKPEDAYAQVQPLINSLVALLAEIGVIAK